MGGWRVFLGILVRGLGLFFGIVRKIRIFVVYRWNIEKFLIVIFIIVVGNDIIEWLVVLRLFFKFVIRSIFLKI